MLSQQLAIFVAPRLEQAPLNGLPEPVRARLRAKARAQREVAAGCVQALGELDQAFGARGIPYLLLKGIGLSLRYYGGLQQRSFWDLDLLVHEADLGRACRMLAGLGFAALSPEWLHRPGCFRFLHALDYQRADLKLDLHGVLVRHPSYRLDYERIFAEAEPLTVDGLPLRVPGPDAELSFLLLSLFADLQRHRARLRAFVDLHRMLQQAEPDWPHFFARRRAERTDTACAAILAMYLRLLAMPDALPRLRAHLPAAAARPPRGGDLALWRDTPLAWPGKRWAWGILPASVVRSALWWLVSLPVRLCAHRHFDPRRLARWLPWSGQGRLP